MKKAELTFMGKAAGFCAWLYLFIFILWLVPGCDDFALELLEMFSTLITRGIVIYLLAMIPLSVLWLIYSACRR